MIKKFLFLALIIFNSASFAAVTVQDDAKQTITLAKPATRIISLAPNLTEILYAIGAGNKIVAVGTANDFPAAAKKLPVVANDNEINLEAVASLHPDLIVAWLNGNSAQQTAALQKLHIPVYFAQFTQIADISHAMQNLAVLTGEQKAATPVIARLNKQFALLAKKYSKAPKITVFYQIWHEPLFTINHQSIINQVINLCGGKNIYATTYGLAPQISVESVIALNPDVIISSEENPNWSIYWLQWPSVAAVKNKNMYRIPADLIERPGPRLIQGAALLCQDLAESRNKNSVKFENNN